MNRRGLARWLPLAAAAGMTMTAHAGTVSLATTMNADSYIAEFAFTGAFAQIGLGDGSLGSVGAFTGDADGLYNANDIGSPNPQPFGAIDLFPRETDFEVGSITFDDGLVTGVGTETVQIDTLDLSGFWQADPSRTSGGAPTVISDISDAAIGLWFGAQPGSINFGALDGDDTVTFVDGVLTSIDLSVSTNFIVGTFDFAGTLSIDGNAFSYQIADGSFVADLNGTVLAPVPLPAAVWFLGSGLLALLGVARRRA